MPFVLQTLDDGSDHHAHRLRATRKLVQVYVLFLDSGWVPDGAVADEAMDLFKGFSGGLPLASSQIDRDESVDISDPTQDAHAGAYRRPWPLSQPLQILDIRLRRLHAGDRAGGEGLYWRFADGSGGLESPPERDSGEALGFAEFAN